MNKELTNSPESLADNVKQLEELEFKSFFVDVMKGVERCQRHLQYGPLLHVYRKGKAILVSTLWLNRKQSDHAYVLVAEDTDGTVVGVRNAHVDIKQREARGYVYVRDRGKGIGSIMEVGNLLFLGSVAAGLKQNITQIYFDQNDYDLNQLKNMGKKDDPAHQVLVARKEAEHSRWESIYGAYGIAGLTDSLRRKIEWRKSYTLPDECITEVMSADSGNYIDLTSPPVPVNRYDLSIKTCGWIELAYSYKCKGILQL